MSGAGVSGAGVSRAEVCVAACADAWRGDGAILASAIGAIPRLSAQLARRTFEPDLMLTDGEAYLIDDDGHVEGWMPFRSVFTMAWAGKRHVMMGAAQIDRYGNQNISCIGDWARPKAQLLGVRGAPGNTISHTTSYWVPKHSPRVFTEKVDMVSGIGWDRGAAEIRVVITDLAVLDFATPDHRMRLRSTHPGVSVDEVVAATGFELVADDPVTTAEPSPAELAIIRRLSPDLELA